MKCYNIHQPKYSKSLFRGLFISLISFTIFSCTKDPAGGTGSTGTNPVTERIITDTSYGTDLFQKMDIFLPAGRNTSTKVVIFIHGGGWESGSKSDGEYVQMFNLIKQKWPEAAVATINYRLASNPAIHYNEIMEDVRSAVNFMINNKNSFLISDTLAMMGASAGAHLAMLYTYKYNADNKVKCVADFFGPAKLSDWDWYNSFNIWLGKAVKDILIQFNGSAWDLPLYNSNSPYSVATAQSKPTIIFHGTLDAIVPLYQSQWLRGQLNSLNVPYAYHEYIDGHGFNSVNTADAMDKAIAFFKLHMR